MWFTTFSLLALAISALGDTLNEDKIKSVLTELERKQFPDSSENDAFVKSCGGHPAEIVFIIDNSFSIYPPDFDEQILFIKDFVRIFTISPKAVRMGVVTFGDSIIRGSTFNLTMYTDEESLRERIGAIQYNRLHGYDTETGLAIEYARTQIFNDARQGVDKIAIVITDGNSTKPYETSHQAMLAKKDNIIMIAIGVGNKISQKELNIIASSADYVFTIQGYSMLETIKKKLGMKTCQVPTTTPPPTTLQMEQPCDKDIDINFVFDSGMMGDKATADVIKFIKSSITDQDLRKSNIKFGTVAGSCNKVYGFNLNTYASKAEILRHFDQFHQTSLARLITTTREISFSVQNGGRPAARKVALIFLKGKLKDPVSVIEQAKAARDSDIEIFVVNMDRMNSYPTINSIVSQKAENHILNAESSTSMVYLSGDFANRICKISRWSEEKVQECSYVSDCLYFLGEEKKKKGK